MKRLAFLLCLIAFGSACSGNGSKVFDASKLQQIQNANTSTQQPDGSLQRGTRADESLDPQAICWNRPSLPTWDSCVEKCQDKSGEPLSDAPEICQNECQCLVGQIQIGKAADGTPIKQTITLADLRGVEVDSRMVPDIGYRFASMDAMYGRSGTITPFATGNFRFPNNIIPYRSRMFQGYGSQLNTPYCNGSVQRADCGEQNINFNHFMSCRYMISQMDEAMYQMEQQNYQGAQEIFYRIEPTMQRYGTQQMKTDFGSLLGIVGKSFVGALKGTAVGVANGLAGYASWIAGSTTNSAMRQIQQMSFQLSMGLNQYGQAAECQNGMPPSVWYGSAQMACVPCVDISCR